MTSRPLRVHLLGEPEEPTAPVAFFRTAKGFRPFFFLAALFAASILPIWMATLLGLVSPDGYLDVVSWHAHEMIFGFAVAVIAGFLLTAVGNWTQRETAVGYPLLALCLLWLAGRFAVTFAPVLPKGLAAAVDLAFLPALAYVLARPLVATKNRRNFVMLGILTALAAANAAVHAGALGLVSPLWQRRGSLVGVDLVILVILVIAGRVFPMFTRNATGVASIRSIPPLDVLTVAGMGLLVVADTMPSPAFVREPLSVVVGVLAAARAVFWGARHTAREPLLWILHVGYAWIPVGLVLRAVPSIPSAIATHALTLGAIGSLTLGMMARVALGHTGRPLGAPRPLAFAFALVTLAAVVRVVLPFVRPAWYRTSLVAAGGLWTAAFALYLVVYAPILATPRIDGKAG